MILLLFSILTGFVLCLLLCLPFNFYLAIVILYLLSVVLVIINRKHAKFRNTKLYPLLLFSLALSLLACSMLIFSTSDKSYDIKAVTSKEKKAVILYCSGQPTHYSTAYAATFFRSEPTLFKPFLAMKLKLQYYFNKSSLTDHSVTKVASEFKNSLLRNYPYYFYMAFSDTSPNIFTALKAALDDGCGDITIVSYSTKKLSLPSALTRELAAHGVLLHTTPMVYSSPSFAEAVARRIEAAALKQDAIILDIGVSKNIEASNSTQKYLSQTSENIRSLLVEKGFAEEKLFISSDTEKSLQAILTTDVKQACVVNLTNDNFDINACIKYQGLNKKFSSRLKINELISWGYNKYLVRALIEATRNRQ